MTLYTSNSDRRRVGWERVFQLTLYTLGIVAAAAFMVTKSAALLAWATSDSYKYGDLYRLCGVKRFKPAAPLPHGIEERDSLDENVALESQPVILVGDSFSFFDSGKQPFHMQLSHALGKPVFSIFNLHHEALHRNFFQLLKSQQQTDLPPRFLVYEIVEREIASKFRSPLTGKETVSTKGPRLWVKLARNLFSETESRHQTLLKHSFITAPWVGVWNTVVFEIFRQMPPETPMYSLNPPFLFYKDEVDCFRTNHSDALVKELAENIARFDDELKQRYNCILVFLPIPNKITVYSQLARGQKYDEFLPRLRAALKNRGICTVDVFSRFKQSSTLLYWPSDTHWNDAGIKLAVEQTITEWPMFARSIEDTIE
jgi:SGNH hydrolase-like domain, acetyltransferase AlgX